MDEKQKSVKPNKGWMRYVLVGSLGVNILVAGLVGGAYLRAGPPKQIRLDQNVTMLGLRDYFRALDVDSKVALRQTIRVSPGKFRVGREFYRRHLKNLAEAMAAEPYNPDRVARVLAVQATVIGDNIAFGHQLLLDRINEMTPQERRKMARKLLAPIGKPPGNRPKPQN